MSEHQNQPGPPAQPVSFSQFNIKAQPKGLIGDNIRIERVVGKEIIVEAYRIRPSDYKDKFGKEQNRLEMQFTLKGERHILFTSSTLMEMIQSPGIVFPFTTTIVKKEDRTYQFT